MSISSIAASPALAPSAPVGITQAKPIKVAVPGASAATPGAAPTAAQEAAETPDVTRKEAAKGDRQAVALLAKESAAHPQVVAPGGKNGLNVRA